MSRKPTKKTRRNTEPGAAALTEAFHGRPAKKVTELSEIVSERAELADLGRLVSLELLGYKLPFDSNVRLASTPEGGSLYFVGGDQALDLASLGIEDATGKDHMDIGQVKYITYFTSKAFHNFEPMEYRHKFGEDGGELPLLCYDTLNEALYLVGGTYTVKPEGIVN